ncbi:MAG: DUF4430 domain-containing protein [Solirubrobacterales bacterium]
MTTARVPRHRQRGALIAAWLLLTALVLPACGLGSGDEAANDSVRLTVTKNFGTEDVVSANDQSARPGDTALKLLDRNAEVETAYGGGFVQAVNGTEGTGRSGGGNRRLYDWFFYVNGIESPVGAEEYALKDGDWVWWDYREWTAAQQVPAVVGLFPEPFVHGFEGKRFPTRIDCLGRSGDCQAVSDALGDQDISASIAAERVRAGSEVLRVVVGTWDKVREDRAAAKLADGPEASGVFAAFEGKGDGTELAVLDTRGDETRRLGPGAGLVAAVALSDSQPVWVVTGVDDAGVEAAVELLEPESLRTSYAVAVEPEGRPVPVPVP